MQGRRPWQPRGTYIGMTSRKTFKELSALIPEVDDDVWTGDQRRGNMFSGYLESWITVIRYREEETSANNIQ